MTASSGSTIQPPGHQGRWPYLLGLWLLAFVLLPNIPFVLVRMVTTFNQAPFAMLYALIGTMVGLMGWSIVPALLMVLAFAFNLTLLISEFFGLDLRDALEQAHLILELNPLTEPFYVAGVIGCLASLGATIFVIHRQFERLRRLSPWLGMVTVMLLPVPLTLVSGKVHSLNGELRDWAGNLWENGFAGDGGAPETVVSAVTRSGFAGDRAIAERRHLVLVVVEAMGMLDDPAADAAVFGGETGHLRISRGVIPYEGSTTAAEMRELCGTTESFRAIRDQARSGADCLPARLRDLGYRTSGLHGMTEMFYDRQRWWPEVGLDDVRFFEDLKDEPGLGLCGGVFTGICDQDLVATIFSRVRGAAGPQFIYWLTLNSHIPVSAEVTRETGCDKAPAPFATDRVCTLGRMWAGIIEKLAKGLAEPGLPPMDVLIVGDHAPPLFLPSDRRQFQPDVVPWVLLQTP